jgi:hypothetical protein
LASVSDIAVYHAVEARDFFRMSYVEFREEPIP